MQKTFVSILAVFYLLLSTGVIINQHYCMNQLDGTSFFADADSNCHTCGMPNARNKCCHDKITVLKLQDDHVASQHHFRLPRLLPATIAYTGYHLPGITNKYLHEKPEFPPPRQHGQNTYIYNCVFRI